ncbi:hypothetical protein FQN54_001186 [Arachnomyces sp. PD_36]|nr:hypothetical protein FQN54_001186 [Arachnomyces sp. PD_36]
MATGAVMDLSVRGTATIEPTNTTYIPEYTRGLLGVNVTRDHLLTQLLCGSMGIVAVAILFVRFAQIGHSYLRKVNSMSASRRQQRYWGVEDSDLWAFLKKHILYSPLGGKRHNREVKLSEAVNVGTVPSRFQTFILVLYIGSQIAYCTFLDYDVNEPAALIAELRGRSGTLAVLNMIPLFLLAGRNNPLIPILHVSFDTYNLLHRWMGRIVVLESITHTLAWLANALRAGHQEEVAEKLRTEPFFIWGLVSVSAMCFLILHSPSPIRHAFYETFLHLHQLGALLALIGLYIHIDVDGLPQLPWVQFIIAIWVFERSARLVRLIYLNVSRRKGMTKVIVQALPNEACRVTFFLPRHVSVSASAHVYAYIPSVAFWMSHPFSVAWVEPSSCTTRTADPEYGLPTSNNGSTSTRLEKEDFSSLDKNYNKKGQQPTTTITLIMVARTGMTRKLFNKARAAPDQILHTNGYLEGPYSSHPSSFGSYGTVVLFSAGVGITHHLLHVRDLLLRAGEGTVPTRRIYMIWSVRTTESLIWIREYMDQILQLPNRRDILTIKLFVSKPRSNREISSPSDTIHMFPGRCRPDVVIDDILPDRVGATAVSVCGPGAFADEVRDAARRRIGKGMVIDFVEEAFTW